MLPTQPARTRAGAFGVVAVIMTVIAVVGCEFLLLHFVYHRADSVRAQQVVAARLQGRLDSPLTPATVAAARDDLAALPGSAASAVSAALDHATAPGAAQAAQRAATSLSRGLADRVASLNREADVIWVALLLAASFGWMGWFRKLVSRHRALQRQITEQDLRADGEARLVALVHNSTDVIAVLDADSTVVFATPSTHSVLGWAPDDLIGRRWIDGIIHADDLAAFVSLLAAQRSADMQVSMRARHRDGRVLHLEGTMTNLLGDRSVGGIVLTVRDVTERHALEQQLTHHAFHDSLTGLANRRLLADRLDHAIARSARNTDNRPVIVFFDLDDFKHINDTLGHGVGDRLLVEIAARLDSVVRPADTVARLGGDEFAILMEDSDVALAEALATRLQRVVSRPIEIDGVSLAVTASIGIAQADTAELTWDDVLRNADVAMYLAKDRGKAGFAVYEQALHAESIARLALHAELQRALRDEEFVVHYQPSVELRTGRVVGFEALVRWNRPGHGLVGPDEFIDEAERCGLIVPLGTWVLRRACMDAVSMTSEQAGALTMAVNVSARQLDRDDFVAEVLGVLALSGLPAHRLCLEITETALLRDLERVGVRLGQLRERGVRIAVDDFGTGYSSLSYLAKLPVDVLKVDRSFVERVMLDEQNASVTQAILAMSNALRLTTVAEGIEEVGQADWLASADCSLGQGWLWSRAVPLAEAKSLVESGRVTAVTALPSGPRSRALTRVPHEPAAPLEDAPAG